MTARRIAALALTLAALSAPPAAHAQGRPDPSVLLAAQREAMAKLAMLDGEWRGTAWTLSPGGEKHVLVQTERVGPFLDGAVRVVEGRGYEPDGRVGFNALGVISYRPDLKTYGMRSWAMGHGGDFVLTPTADGFTWEIPAGPMTIRYTATVKDGVWREVGDRLAPGREPARFFEMELKRLGDSDWPAAGAVPRE